jgi:hypothetical protein
MSCHFHPKDGTSSHWDLCAIAEMLHSSLAWAGQLFLCLEHHSYLPSSRLRDRELCFPILRLTLLRYSIHVEKWTHVNVYSCTEYTHITIILFWAPFHNPE